MEINELNGNGITANCQYDTCILAARIKNQVQFFVRRRRKMQTNLLIFKWRKIVFSLT